MQEGLRAGEVAALELGDIDFYDNQMIVRGKGGHERTLPISDETAEAIRRYLSQFPGVAGPLVRSYRDPYAGVSANHVSLIVSRVMKDAQVSESGHGLRHTAAGDALRAGANLRQVQAMLGHANIATTSRYLGLVDVADLRRAMGGRRYAEGRQSGVVQSSAGEPS